jgi:putative endonuclease
VQEIPLTVIPNEAGRSWAARVRDRRAAIVSAGGERLATYYVYIMTNRTRRLYIGLTNDLHRRVYEHKHRLMAGFTSKCFLERLVYFEESDDIGAAIAGEKELKGWRRSKKIALIHRVNPQWSDLSRDLIDRVEASPDKSLRGDPSPTPPNSTPFRSG